LNLKEQGGGTDFNFSFKNLKNIPQDTVNGVLPVITSITLATDFSSLVASK
jgi:hypothetical protein